MRLTKKVPYKLKTLIPALGLAGISLFSACESNEPAQKQHDTVYSFGKGFINQEQIKNIAQSMDSIEVRYVILESQGVSMDYAGTGGIRLGIDRIKKAAKPENDYKLRGCGILRNLMIDSLNDSIYLTDFGFVFIDSHIR